jgi:ABC-type bacteriocin/lantibiotic exporter with double-glycine peptidase domain
MNILYIFIIVVVGIYFLSIILNTVIRLIFYRKIKKDTETVINKTQEQFQFWLKKLDSESKELKKNTDIIEREYRELLAKKRKENK